jgi:hypothetical protein
VPSYTLTTASQIDYTRKNGFVILNCATPEPTGWKITVFEQDVDQAWPCLPGGKHRGKFVHRVRTHEYNCGPYGPKPLPVYEWRDTACTPGYGSCADHKAFEDPPEPQSPLKSVISLVLAKIYTLVSKLKTGLARRPVQQPAAAAVRSLAGDASRAADERISKACMVCKSIKSLIGAFHDPCDTCSDGLMKPIVKCSKCKKYCFRGQVCCDCVGNELVLVQDRLGVEEVMNASDDLFPEQYEEAGEDDEEDYDD